MTPIRFKYAKPSVAGNLPLAGTITCAPTRKHTIDGDPDTIVLPVPFTVDLPPTGDVTVPLDPSGTGWAWKITVVITGASRTVETVTVPASTTPLDYPDLPRVDPDTLAPDAVPEAAWWAAITNLHGEDGAPGAPGAPGQDSIIPGPPPTPEAVAYAVAGDPVVKATALTVAGHTTDIAANTTAIAANATAIAATNTVVAGHTTNIAANTTAIAGNTTAIAGNTTAIAGNTTNIAGNTTAIAATNTVVAGHTTAIAGNTSAIAGNTTAIAGNTTAIAANATAISDYKTVIVVKQSTNGDDTAAVQAALNTCLTNGGGEVVLSFTGTAWRLGKLTIYRNTTFRCSPGVVIKRKTNTFGFINYATGVNPLADNADPYSGHGNIKIIGGTWDGNIIAESYLAAGFDVFYFGAAKDITIQGVTFKDVLTNHAIDINGIANLTVRDCNFLGFKDVTVEQDRNYVEAIQYSQTTDEAMTGATYALGTPSTNITVENCVFGASGTAGTIAWNAAFGNHSMTNDTLCNDITITGNTFNGQAFGALVLYTFNDVKIRGNTFNNCAYGVKGNNFTNGKKWDKVNGVWITGLATRAETSGIQVTDNRFVDTINTDISILGTNADGGGFWNTCNDIVIADNIMKATTTTKRTGQNIRLLLCKNATIHDNQCDNAQIGIVVDSCVNVNTHDNRVYNTVTYGIQHTKGSVPPATDSTYAVSNRIVNNHVENAGSHGIGNNSLYYSTVEGNSVIDWGRVSPTANGILTSGTNGSLINGNNVRTQYTGLGAAIATATSNTLNVAVTLTNRIVKPDGVMIAMGTGTNNTYGNLTYTVTG